MLGQSQLARRIASVSGLLAISAAAFSSLTSAAQLEPGTHLDSRIPVKPKQATQDQVRDAKSKFAACVVARQRKLASAFVLDRSKLGFDKKFEALLDSACLSEATEQDFGDANVALTVKGDTLRFALAEALLDGEIGSIDPAQLSGAAPLPTPGLKPADYEIKPGRDYTVAQMKALDELRQRDQMSIIMYRFGDCVVRTDPEGSRAVLMTSSGSAAESAGLQALMPSLATCLEKGAQLKFDPGILRGAIAFSYYSLAHAPQQAATAQH